MKKMKKYMVMLPLSAMVLLVTLPAQQADAQFVVSQVLGETVGRVIRAIDLQVQRLQNKTIWLQDAQKTLENQLSKLKLSEIAGWTQRQKELYSQYYSELWQVKSVISSYQRVREMADKESAMVAAYRQAWQRLSADRHFSAEELAYMAGVYAGILEGGVKHMDRLLLAVSPAKMQVDDAGRLALIDEAAEGISRNSDDLKRFTSQNIGLSLERANDEREVQTLRRYYGLE
jgi:hypothetical protein